MAEPYPGKAKGVIQHVEREKRDKTRKGHYLPTLSLDLGIQPLPPTLEHLSHPAPSHVSRDKEGDGRPYSSPYGCVNSPEDRPEQHTSNYGDREARKHEGRGYAVNQHVDYRPQFPVSLNPFPQPHLIQVSVKAGELYCCYSNYDEGYC